MNTKIKILTDHCRDVAFGDLVCKVPERFSGIETLCSGRNTCIYGIGTNTERTLFCTVAIIKGVLPDGRYRIAPDNRCVSFPQVKLLALTTKFRSVWVYDKKFRILDTHTHIRIRSMNRGKKAIIYAFHYYNQTTDMLATIEDITNGTDVLLKIKQDTSGNFVAG